MKQITKDLLPGCTFIVFILVILLLAFLHSGCVARSFIPATLATTDHIVSEQEKQRDAIQGRLTENQENQARISQEVVEVNKDLLNAAKKEGDQMLMEQRMGRVVRTQVLAENAERLAKKELPKIERPPEIDLGWIEGLIKALIDAITGNPALSGGVGLLGVLTALTARKRKRDKTERNEAFAKAEKWKIKAHRVARMNPSTDKDDIEKELGE